MHLPQTPHLRKSSVEFKDFTPSTKYSLLKPHLINFFHNVYIDTAKVFEEFSKFSSNICKLVKKESNRLETLESYKLDYPDYLLGNLLKIFTKLMNVLRTESMLSSEEEKNDSNQNQFLECFKEFADSLLKALKKNYFDKETVD